MPLDPDVQPLVDAINEAAVNNPPIDQQTVTERREGYLALSAIPGPGPDLDHVRDLDLDGVPARSYANDGAHGVFLYIHGGGYTIGDLDSHDQVCRQLALESAATVVSIDYRLAPEHPFPAGVEDALTALRWLDAHRADFGENTRIVVGGDSAGGNLSAVAAITARDEGIDLAAQLLVYPAVDVNDISPSMTENAEGYVLSAETMAWFQQQYRPDPADWRASPILANLAGVAPAHIVTAQFDPLRDQGARYAEALRSAGVEVTLTNYDGVVHVFFQMGPIWKQGAAAVSEVAAAARAALG